MNCPKITRKEAEELVNARLYDQDTEVYKLKKGRIGYGKIEIVELLDKIYGVGTSQIKIVSSQTLK